MSKRPGPPDDVFFPVVPMLDMSFQLLAFFILTFQAPSRETRLDLDLPIAPAALPKRADSAPASERVAGLDTSLTVRATADPEGRLESLHLDELTLEGPDALADRLKAYVKALEGKPLRVVIQADDALLYQTAARLVNACAQAGVGTVRLAPPPSQNSGRGAP